MLLAELAEGFAKIEATTKHHLMAALLSDLFRRAPEDAHTLPYLLEGRLGPPYAAPDIGMDERRLAEAIAQAAGTSTEEVWRRYKQRGDLGLVAEDILPAKDRRVSVQEAFRELMRVAETTGGGAYEEKVKLFAGLLRRLGKLEARYLVRITQGRLRLGVGDATIMDALSIARAGDTSLRPRIERAYALCSDLGLVAETLLTQGPEAVDRIHPTPGRPVLSALAERLPSPQAIIQKLGRVIAEPKYDGLRLQAQKEGERVWLFTRRLENVTNALPDIARSVQQQVAARQAILDGEAVGYDPKTGRFLPFQQTVRRRRKHKVEVMEALYPLRYFVFDLLFLDGQDLTPLPLRERSRRLREIVREEPEGIVFVAPQMETDDPAELRRFFDEMVKQGLEGTLVKRPDSPYHAGARRHNWVKLKPGYEAGRADTYDLVILGYYRGRGKRAKLGIGSLLAAVYVPETGMFRTVARVGSGLTDEEWVQLREMLDAVALPERSKQVDSLIPADVWVEPRYVIEVIASEITRSPRHTCGKVGKEPGYALRFPRVSRFRFDRRPEDATTEREILDLYRMQVPLAA